MVMAYHVFRKDDGGWKYIPFNAVDFAYYRVNKGTQYNTDVPRAAYLHFQERPEWYDQCASLCRYETVGGEYPEPEWHDHPDCPLHGSVPYLNLLDLVAAEEGIEMKDGVELGGG